MTRQNISVPVDDDRGAYIHSGVAHRKKGEHEYHMAMTLGKNKILVYCFTPTFRQVAVATEDLMAAMIDVMEADQ